MNKLEAILQNYIRYIAKIKKLPSISVSIKDRDYCFDFTFSTYDKPQKYYKIASQSKMITGVLIAKLVEDNIINYSDKIIDLVPELKGLNHLNHITIHHLLCHTSGLIIDGFDNYWNNENNFPDKNTLIKILNSKNCIDTPDIYSYSNLGFATLGLVIENICKSSFEEALNVYVLKPLGIKEIFIDNSIDFDLDLYHNDLLEHKNIQVFQDKTNYFASSCGLVSNPSSMVNLIDLVFNQKKLLKTKSLKKLLKIQSKGKYTKYGYGLKIEKSDKKVFYSHSGGFVGGNSKTIFDKNGVIVSYAVNATNGFCLLYSYQIYNLYLYLKTLDLCNITIDKVDGFYKSLWGDFYTFKYKENIICLDFYNRDVVKSVEFYYKNEKDVYLSKTRHDMHYFGYRIKNNLLVGEKYDIFWKNKL